jgi:hypothetical protein
MRLGLQNRKNSYSPGRSPSIALSPASSTSKKKALNYKKVHSMINDRLLGGIRNYKGPRSPRRSLKR